MATRSFPPDHISTADSDAFGQLETALRRQIKDTLDGVNSSYDKLDSSSQTIEQRLPRNLRFRLKTVEDHVKAQETINSSQPVARPTSTPEYHALSAKVKSIDADVTTLLTSKLLAIQSQLDSHKRSLERVSKKTTTAQKDSVIQDLIQRLDKLERQEKVKAPLEIYSTDEIATELLQRLAKGQQLASPDLEARLHLATASKTTPTTETDETARNSSSSQTASHEPEATTKIRKRPALAPSSQRSETNSVEDIIYEEPAPKRFKSSTPATRTSPRRISSMFKAGKSSSQPVTEVELNEKEIERILQDEPRRSSRPPKPSQNPDFMTWLEVKAAKSRKSLS